VGSLGLVNKCERTTSTCAEPFETRTINFQPVTRACWSYTNTFSCVNNDPRSDCNQPKFGACIEEPGSPACVEYDKDLPSTCLHRQHTFRCRIQDATTSQVTNCGSQSYCTNGQCWDTGHPPDSDFAQAVTMLEAGREAGRYLDPATLTVFKGFDNRCVKKLFGLVDCCNKAGTQFGLFTNMNLALGVGAAASSYAFDALFLSDGPNWAIGAIAPNPWAIAVAAMQFAGIIGCSDKEKFTALKKDQRLCHDVGEYCSRKLLFGACLERTHTYCCFNSLLARIINEQGRPQLRRGWGDAKSPDCGGFTPDQLQALNFAKMDLKEFYETLKYDVAGVNGPDAGRTAATVACKVAGKC
jgi:conjugal transfer mating pair stabilization protein TraN